MNFIFCQLHDDQESNDLYSNCKDQLFLPEGEEDENEQEYSSQSGDEQVGEINRTDQQPKFRYFDPFVSSGPIQSVWKKQLTSYSGLGALGCPPIQQTLKLLFPNM
eukprot:TRINITY_DN8430_c0_g1_i1.p1 TRINITY_DN8430_c0_g1~~TRINITY_DN8430_c0_g1_i1.p1  ORF type:complete len:106 (+),score=18.66 TRINITY_DN8430_c0_g1_i1:311-628(+)